MSNAVSYILSIIAIISQKLSVNFSRDGHVVAKVKEQGICQGHPEEVESTACQSSACKTYISFTLPTSHLLANQAKGKVRTGTILSWIECARYKFLNFIKALGESLSSLTASTKSQHSHEDSLMSDGESSMKYLKCLSLCGTVCILYNYI